MNILSTEKVYLFVPNLIGYLRIILVLISFYYMPTNYVACGISYMLSVGLDMVDGYAARLLNQSSRFGAMLDQLTDRCGTLGLLVALSLFYPKYIFLFQISMTIDIACHWLYLHSALLLGRSSHKAIDISSNSVMRIYYESRTVLGFLCLTNELFYCSLYVYYFTPGPSIAGLSLIRLLVAFCAPFAMVKTAISLIHGYVACLNIISLDTNERKK